MAIKAIIFDIGRVLVDFNFREGFKRFDGHTPYTPEAAIQRMKEAGLFRGTNEGSLLPWSFYLRTRELLEFSPAVDFHMFRAVYGSIFTEKPEMTALMRRLAPRYRLALLSNTDMLHRHVLEEQFEHLHLAEVRVYSDVERMMKPDVRIYQAVLERLGGVAPEEAVFLDDLPENVEGARAAGLHAFQFTTRGEVEPKLAAIGVEW